MSMCQNGTAISPGAQEDVGMQGIEPALEWDTHKAMGIKSHLVLIEWANFHHLQFPLCGFKKKNISLLASKTNIFFTRRVSIPHPCPQVSSSHSGPITVFLLLH